MGEAKDPAFAVFLLLSYGVFFTIGAPMASVVVSTEITLDPENMDVSFSRQSLPPQSKFPYVTPDGRQIFLTRDPIDGASHGTTLYNVGRVIYRKPIQFKDAQQQLVSFNTSFTFNITTATQYNKSGDGVAFVMTTDAEIPPNSTGRFFGLMPEFPPERYQRYLAVEFDTFQNLQAEIDDPSASHIGIDINSLMSVAYLDTANQSHPLYLYHNYTFTAWVSYSASTHLIHVWATNSSDSQRPQDPVVSTQCNLSQVFENFTDIYVGIIAASGNNSEAAILYSWNLTVIIDTRGTDEFPLYLVPIVVLGVVICLLAPACYIALGRRRSVKRRREERASIEAASCGARRYRYKQLMQATQRFNEELRIGKGGFSTVYKGVLSDGTQVAVKRMRDGLGMETEMIARELQIISRIRHRHLLQLQGWCYERGEALLVYEYMPGGSLDSYLYGERRSRSGQALDSETRFKILVGVAAALEYLHGDLPGAHRVLHRDVKADNVTDTMEAMLHRDVKAANVLLTDTMEAMLADFGLSRLIADDKLLSTMGAGTPGYVAPEVMQCGRVDDKGDVYSFGVLVLEVACGRRALDPSNWQYSRLLDWVWLRHHENNILDALDPQLAHSLGLCLSSTSSSLASNEEIITNVPAVVATDQMVQRWRSVLHLGLLCCQANPNARPNMREVHQALKECKVLASPPSWTLYPSLSHNGSA